MLIDHQCPQCGAQVTLDETDRLLKCSFCKTRLFLEPTEYFRYSFPLHGKDINAEITQVPYWRFKGMHFACRSGGVKTGRIDRSSLAIGSALFPPSLGIRTQAMNLRFARPISGSRFLAPSHQFDKSSIENLDPSSYEIVTVHETRIVSLGQDDFAEVPVTRTEMKEDKLYYECFVAENVSLIYTPFTERNGNVFDAISDKMIATTDAVSLSGAELPAANLAVKFLSTLCPNCGWELIAENDSCIPLCSHCSRAWQVSGGAYKPVKYIVASPVERKGKMVYLPFWKINVTIRGVDLQNHEDLSRLANVTKLPPRRWKTPVLSFWAPAFKIAPSTFLRLARQMTLANPENEVLEEFGVNVCYPPNLDCNQPAGLLKVILADIAANKKTFMPKLESVEIVHSDPLLVFYPFQDNAYELTDKYASCGIMKNALRWGKNL